MKRTLLYTLIAILAPVVTFAQTGATTSNNENIRDLAANDNTMTILTFDNRYEGVKGHPYLYEDWLLGELVTDKGIRYKDVRLKYNIHRDEISLQRTSTSEVVVLFNEQVSTFVIAGTPFKMIKDREGSRFYEILLNGEYSLLVKRSKKLLKADYEGAYSAGRTSDEFVNGNTDYYIQKSGATPIKIKQTAKSLAQALGANEKELKTTIKMERLDIKVEKDLINLVAGQTTETP